jgi:hypothetical protein
MLIGAVEILTELPHEFVPGSVPQPLIFVFHIA